MCIRDRDDGRHAGAGRDGVEAHGEAEAGAVRDVENTVSWALGIKPPPGATYEGMFTRTPFAIDVGTSERLVVNANGGVMTWPTSTTPSTEAAPLASPISTSWREGRAPVQDLTDALRRLAAERDEAAEYLRVEELRRRMPQLEVELARPDLWDDAETAQSIQREFAEASDDLKLFDRLDSTLDDLITLDAVSYTHLTLPTSDLV